MLGGYWLLRVRREFPPARAFEVITGFCDWHHTRTKRKSGMLLNEIEIHFHFGDGPLPSFLELWFLFLLLLSPLCRAQDEATGAPAPEPPSIQDNSFLIEEAYNQEDGVIQHINSFLRLTQSHDWMFTETDEWPVRCLKHQLSITLMAAHAGNFPDSGAGWGDTALNYRYQLLGSGQAKLAVAPRLSLLLPTGESATGRGLGGLGLQTNLPVSVQHSSHWTTHWNAGATWVPRARNELGESASVMATNLGQSIVWLAKPRINFLVETYWSAGESVVGVHKTQWSQDLYVSPGIRWAFNFRNGLQIVPGIAVPIGVGPSAGEKGMIFYLSFEHPFALAHSKIESGASREPGGEDPD